MKHRLHVINLVHTELVPNEYNQCAYTEKVNKFVEMMVQNGNHVITYSNGRPCLASSEHITIFDEERYHAYFDKYEWWCNKNWPAVSWDSNEPYWRDYNKELIEALKREIQKGDYICLITGWPHKDLVEFFPNNRIVEFGIGYEGILPNTFHVFESYAWMHCLYGKQGPSSVDGRFYDTVIPNYFRVDEFPEHVKGGDYYLFMSRMTPRKGYEIAIETTRRIGAKLIIAGTPGDMPLYDHVEYVGFADAKKRGELLSNAIALFCPTLYIEPFGGITIEANLCGTPALTTDFGCFTENLQNGINGYRCKTIAEFERAALEVKDWSSNDYKNIRANARKKYSTKIVANQYHHYFNHLDTLNGEGFYSHYVKTNH